MAAFANIDSLITLPVSSTNIYKDECAFTFAAPDDEEGIYICLKTFIGVGPKVLTEYVEITGNCVFLQYRIIKTPKIKAETDKAISAKPKKLVIEAAQDNYSITESWCLVRFQLADGKKQTLDLSLPDYDSLSDKLKACITRIQNAESAILTAQRAGAAEAWELENQCAVSKYADSLVQLDNGVKILPTGHKCHKCDLSSNLWLNLSDGVISCGRRFWDGSGGNNHAVEHYELTKYPLAVKLGTITPTSAEVFSYPEDDMVTDPHLAQHLAHFGINVMSMQKTDQTMMELEIAANERLGEWFILQESSKPLKPLFGPGLTGIANLGNTCYINSALQVLFAVPQFRWRYAHALPQLTTAAMQDMASSISSVPVDNVGLQLAKLGHALCSGAYSFPLEVPSEADQPTECISRIPGIRPRMFKYLIGKGHNEFSSNRQQDVHEFFNHLFHLLEKDVDSQPPFEVVVDSAGTRRSAISPFQSLTFSVEDRLQCGATGKVHYTIRTENFLSLPIPLEMVANANEVAEYNERKRTAEATGLAFKEDPVYMKISLEDCLSAWATTETIEGFRSPATNPPGQITTALHTCRFTSFPDFLCVQMLKFTFDENWLPKKLNIALQLDTASTAEDGSPRSEWHLDLTGLRSVGGPQPGEVAMPSDTETIMATVTPKKPTPDASIVEQLLMMGFSIHACQRACLATDNSGVEAASNWMMEHMEDSDFNDPIPAVEDAKPESGVAHRPPSPAYGALSSLIDMGFSREVATRALQLCNNDVEQAVNLAFNEPDRLANPIPVQQNVANSTTTQQAQSGSTNSTRSPLSDGAGRYQLVAFISHMGNSTSTGHYVCHVKRSSLSQGIPGVAPACTRSPLDPSKDDEWVIFNDEKVARSESPPFQHGYLYFFRRVDAVTA